MFCALVAWCTWVLKLFVCGLSNIRRLQVLTFVEMFAGEGNVSRVLRMTGHYGASLDILYNKGMDINSNAGMAHHGYVASDVY
jgi:hypothetical protein